METKLKKSKKDKLFDNLSMETNCRPTCSGLMTSGLTGGGLMAGGLLASGLLDSGLIASGLLGWWLFDPVARGVL